MTQTQTGPIVINAPTGQDPSAYALDIRLTANSQCQALVIRDHNGAPIFTCGPTGGPAVWGDRLGATPGLFGPELAIDGALSIPALVYLTAANLGNYTSAPHYWIGQVGDPVATLANLKNMLGAYVACQPGDRYSRTDTPTVAGQREYVCIKAGAPLANQTAGTWEAMT